MEKLEAKKFIALMLTVVFSILSVVAVIRGIDVPSSFITTFSMIISFYFGVHKGQNQ